ncbi:thiamine biosynthesis protein [Coccidioides immitis RMSCC 3703]|uniref:4-amino-5-hydroxymethyl-2-methylpyrimidine phosphate synthase n=1 Tax=Coccidioides immitis RMSCC 3703 TaxID=454286 RepID=A0A0J8R8Y6_COCIT|nr:thiamine biosynthesis protein [Coccidioides immitis RMSCC 3703]
MRAVKKATDYVLANPAAAYEEYIDMKPIMATPVNRKIFERSYAYFSRDLKNVARDWEKVTNYGKRLEILDAGFKPNYTNEFLTWDLDAESADPTGDQKRMCALQKQVAREGGFRRVESVSADFRISIVLVAIAAGTLDDNRSRTTQVKKQRKEYGRKRLEKRASELLQMGLQTAKRQWWVIQGKTETGQTW